MNTIEKIQNDIFSFNEFNESQKNFILSLVKMSYLDGLTEGKNEITNRIVEAISNEYDHMSEYIPVPAFKMNQLIIDNEGFVAQIEDVRWNHVYNCWLYYFRQKDGGLCYRKEESLKLIE